MNRQPVQAERPRTQVARWKIEVSAVLAAMGIAVAVVPPIADAGGRAGPGLTRRSASPFSRLAAVPSHNARYRASLVAASDPNGASGSRAWVVEVRTATGLPVEHATLALESWMPDDDAVRASRAHVAADLGAGRYRIDGLRFDRRGWWNVRLQVVGSSGTDSLAFNLVR